ncbi:MAG: hypothetical protein ACRC5M_07460 [Anaeroplasmataceae bacterium]
MKSIKGDTILTEDAVKVNEVPLPSKIDTVVVTDALKGQNFHTLDFLLSIPLGGEVDVYTSEINLKVTQL